MPTLEPPLINRCLNDREEKLDELFCRWNEARETMFSRTGRLGRERSKTSFMVEGVEFDLDAYQRMPLAWNLSYRKLEVLMRYMTHLSVGGSAEFKGMHASLCEWYGRGKWRRQRVRRVDQFTKKKYEVEEMVFVGGERANAHKVLDALGWLEGHFPGEIYLPREFIDIAA